MTTDTTTDIRLQNVERVVGQLSDQVANVAKFMERLVSIEERNSFMTEKHEELKTTLKDSVTAMAEKNKELEGRVSKIQERMTWMMAIYSVVTATLAVAAPHLIKLIHIGGAA